MSLPRLFISLLCTIIFATTASAQTSAQSIEVHAVGVYEGDVKTDGKVHGPETRITVDRAKTDVVLVLGSYRAVRWIVTTTAQTTIRDIYVHGHEASRSEVVLNGERFQPNTMELRGTYRPEGENFRALVNTVSSVLNVDGIASFHGAYTAPDEAFLLDAVEDKDRNRADYLGSQVRPEALTDALRPFMFAGATPLARLDSDGFYLRQDGAERHFPVTLDVPPPSSRGGTAAYDPKRQILYGATAWHTGYFYTYDITKDTWSATEQRRGMVMTGVVFDEARDRIVVGGGFLAREMGSSAKLHAMGPSGALTGIKHDPFIGLSDLEDPGNGPAAQIRPIAIDGDLLLVRGENRFGGGRDRDRHRTYLVNLDTGAVTLVAFQG